MALGICCGYVRLGDRNEPSLAGYRHRHIPFGLISGHYLLALALGWRGMLAWDGLGLAAFVAVVLAIRAEAKNLRAGRRTATGPSGNVGQ